MKPTPYTTKELTDALNMSLRLNKHYATLLNQYDNGGRHPEYFSSIQNWIDRLYETGKPTKEKKDKL